MKALSCEGVQRLLDAFHDGELTMDDEVAVGAHVARCDRCADALCELRWLGERMRAAVGRRSALSNEEASGYNTAVVTRMKAERDASFVTYVRLMFDDMHLVYASAGALTAATVCVVMMLGMMRFAADNRPDSLGAIVNVLAMPLECDAAADIAEAGCHDRWAERVQRANAAAEQDAVFTLDSVMVQQGRLASLAVLRSRKHQSASDQVEMIEGLLDAVSRARLDLQPLGLSENMVRMVARTTVRANKPQPVDWQLPPVQKKRVASQSANAAAV